MSFGIEAYGSGSFGALEIATGGGAVSHSATASLTSSPATISSSATRSSGVVAHTATATLTADSSTVSAAASHGVYDYRIAVIGDSNASGRGTNNQTYTNGSSIQTDLFNNAGSIVTLADPWDGGTNTYAALDDGASAVGSYIPRLAQRFINANKKTLWIPANKGGTQAADWAYSTNTATCYGAMKARIDAAGGADIIIVHLGANDAISGVSQSTFKTRVEAIVTSLLSDYPSAKVYLQKIHHFSGYTTQVDAIRAGVDDVWNGSSGARVGADLESITTNVHYTTDTDLDTVASRTYSALFAHDATASVVSSSAAVSASASRTGASVTHMATASLVATNATISSSASTGTLTLTPADIQAIVSALLSDPRTLTVQKFLGLK